jgi:GT2 family glycosyltransferase
MSQPNSPSYVDPIGLGFVVIGRNEGERLSRCMESLKAIDAPVAYADSASTDDSLNVAQEAGAIIVALDRSQPLNAARGRNAGLASLIKAHPSLEFVQFIDGDCELQIGWVEMALEFLRGHPRAAVACGRRLEAHPGASIYNRICNEEWDTPIGQAQSCGGDAMMRLTALDAAGVFDPTLMAGEEPELCSRLRGHGWEVWRLGTPMTRHDAAMTRFSQWMRRAFRSGYGYVQVWLSTRRTDRLYTTQLRSAGLWSLLVPLVVLLTAALLRKPLVILALPAIYFLQIARIAARRDMFLGESWRYAWLMLAAKFPEFLGVLSYIFDPNRSRPIDYKGTTKS